jgi:sporulation protein YlmC with PRC-barrel domain
MEDCMKNLARIAAATALGFAALPPVLAAEEGPVSDSQQDIQGSPGTTTGQVADPEGMTSTTAEKGMDLRRTSKIVGENVATTRGETLGEIKEIVIDAMGRISYVAVSSGGVLGVGGELHPVPWRALRWDDQKGSFVLNIDKEAFKQAPRFSSENWPSEPSPEWADFYRQKGISEGFGATER